MAPSKDIYLRSLEPVLDSLECPICTDPFNAEHMPIKLGCGHAFGAHCVFTWCESNSKNANRCPLCRAELFESEYVSDDDEAVAENETPTNEVMADEDTMGLEEENEAFIVVPFEHDPAHVVEDIDRRLRRGLRIEDIDGIQILGRFRVALAHELEYYGAHADEYDWMRVYEQDILRPVGRIIFLAGELEGQVLHEQEQEERRANRRAVAAAAVPIEEDTIQEHDEQQNDESDISPERGTTPIRSSAARRRQQLLVRRSANAAHVAATLEQSLAGRTRDARVRARRRMMARQVSSSSEGSDKQTHREVSESFDQPHFEDPEEVEDLMDPDTNQEGSEEESSEDEETRTFNDHLALVNQISERHQRRRAEATRVLDYPTNDYRKIHSRNRIAHGLREQGLRKQERYRRHADRSSSGEDEDSSDDDGDNEGIPCCAPTRSPTPPQPRRAIAIPRRRLTIVESVSEADTADEDEDEEMLDEMSEASEESTMHEPDDDYMPSPQRKRQRLT